MFLAQNYWGEPAELSSCIELSRVWLVSGRCSGTKTRRKSRSVARYKTRKPNKTIRIPVKLTEKVAPVNDEYMGDFRLKMS